MSTRQQERDIAIRAVREAARLCEAVQVQISPEVLEKKDRSPVTVADFGSQAVVCRTLREAFPGDPILAEEDATELRQPENAEILRGVTEHVQALAGRHGTDREAVLAWIDYGNLSEYRDRFWTLDPIDGTKGFLRKDQYAIALALIEDGVVQVAALACPNLPPSLDEHDAREIERGGQVLAAIRGEGTVALSLADEDGAVQPVQVSPLRDPAAARFCESFVSAHSSHGDAEAVAARLGITRPPRRLDSQAKYAIVARGEADIYLRLPTRAAYVEKVWDHAAGALIIGEAGGTVTDVRGRPLDFSHGATLKENRGVIVTNGPLHEAVLQAVAAVGVTG